MFRHPNNSVVNFRIINTHWNNFSVLLLFFFAWNNLWIYVWNDKCQHSAYYFLGCNTVKYLYTMKPYKPTFHPSPHSFVYLSFHHSLHYSMLRTLCCKIANTLCLICLSLCCVSVCLSICQSQSPAWVVCSSTTASKQSYLYWCWHRETRLG